MPTQPQTCFHRAFEQASQHIGCTPAMCSLLQSNQREITVEVPLYTSDGSIQVFRGYRVQHSNALGPFKGGLRFHPQADLQHFRDLAFVMTWKTALMKIPFGGAKGGITCDPDQLSHREMETLTKRFIDNMSPVLGPEFDIPAPDVGSGPREMSWIFEAYSKQNGYRPGVVTGKPLSLGGICRRVEATGKGVCLITRLAARWLGWKPEEMTVAIQGFGNVGGHAALLLHRSGVRVVAISDSSSALFNPEGLDIEACFEHAHGREEKGLLEDIDTDADTLPSDDLLTLDVDVLIPAAMENALHEGNADKVKAELVIEAANIPLSLAAEDSLTRRGVHIVPDILANAGGVTVSYFEWAQNHHRYHWKQEQVDREFGERMSSAWEAVSSKADEEGISLRDAAYRLAVARVNEAIHLRGF